jgi:hypothetical protein
MEHSWTNSNSMITARRGFGNAGTQTAALAAGGFIPGNTGATEEYDGNSWVTSNPLNTVRRFFNRLWHTNSCFSIWWHYYS